MRGEFISLRGRVNKAVFVYFWIFAFVLLLLVFTHMAVTGEMQVEVLFSPRDSCAAQIRSYLDRAEKSIDIAMYYLTDRILAQALVRAKERGIKVRVYLDGDQKVQKHAKGRYLEGKGVNVRYEYGVGLMHDKFCIIDEDVVITGSYNWTTAADLKNDETLLIIHSSELATTFRNQFEKFWQGKYVDVCEYKDESRLEKVESSRSR